MRADSTRDCGLRCVMYAQRSTVELILTVFLLLSGSDTVIMLSQIALSFTSCMNVSTKDDQNMDLQNMITTHTYC